MIKGLRKRPTYDEVAEIVENDADIIKKYPDRRAITMRNHPYLTTLDGESFLNALNFTQENMIKGQQRDLLVREYATQTDEMSHLEIRATKMKDRGTGEGLAIMTKSTDSGTGDNMIGTRDYGIGDNMIKGRTKNVQTNTQIRGREPYLETRDIGTGDNMIRTRDVASSAYINKSSSSQERLRHRSPITIRRIFSPVVSQTLPPSVPMFDLSVGDDVTMPMEEELATHLGLVETKAGTRRMKLRSKFTDMLQDIRGSSSSAAAADVIEDLDLSEVFPMQVNKEGDQQKRDATSPPSSNKKKNKRVKARSDLLEIGDNPEEEFEKLKRELQQAAKSSSSSSAAAPEETTEAIKQVGVEKDTNTKKSYWKGKSVAYIYQQLELDGMRFTNMQKAGKEDVQDHVLGKKVKSKGKKLTKAELLEMLYKSRKI